MTSLPEPLPPEPPLPPAGERIAAVAGPLFYERGIRAVGVELLAETAGTTKKTLYDRFGSKDALVAHCLRLRARRWQAHVLAHLEQVDAPGPQRVLAVLDALGTWMADNDRGCGFINAFAELGGTDHPAVPVIRSEKSWVRDLYVALVDEAGLAPADVLGAQLHLLHEGAIVALTAGDRDDSLALAKRAGATLLAGSR